MMSMTVSDLKAMRHPFEACQCGSTEPEHYIVSVSRTRGGNWRINTSHHWWSGKGDGDGIWWASFGTSGARYISGAASPSKVLSAARKRVEGLTNATLRLAPSFERALEAAS